MKKLLSYDDVLIIPKFSSIESRKDVDLSTFLGRDKLIFPIMTANMDTITGSRMANEMARLGGAAAIHRFMSVEASIEEFKKAPGAWMSIGVGKDEEARYVALKAVGCSRFLIDVAHAANAKVVTLVQRLCSTEDISLVVGNFAGLDDLDYFVMRLTNNVHTNDSIQHLAQIKAFKIGVGSGANCSTRVITGCGIPTLQAILDIREKYFDFPLIADGGIKNSGDIAKVLAAGANMVMIGSLLAGTDETPGAVIHPEGEKSCPSKRYSGSASLEAYMSQGKVAAHRTPEGISRLVPCKGPVEDVINNLTAGLRSAFSYVGAQDLQNFKRRAKLAEASPSSHVEGTPFGK